MIHDLDDIRRADFFHLVLFIVQFGHFAVEAFACFTDQIDVEGAIALAVQPPADMIVDLDTVKRPTQSVIG